MMISLIFDIVIDRIIMETEALKACRVIRLNDLPIRENGGYVLYWMTAFRRTRFNFSLDRAIEWAYRLKKPLLIFEPLRLDYPWACDRFHQFVVDGMKSQSSRFATANITYFPYVEPSLKAGKGLLKVLSDHACVVLTDDHPNFFLPNMQQSAIKQVSTYFEKVDSNGIFPLSQTPHAFITAVLYRRFLQNNLKPYFYAFPSADPLAGLPSFIQSAQIPSAILDHWQPTNLDLLDIGQLAINHEVKPFEQGGEALAIHKMNEFFSDKLLRYDTHRNQIDQSSESGLSPFLHFGQISTHMIVDQLLKSIQWTPDCLAPKATGSRTGWWGVAPCYESFLDQVITWRELGFVFQQHTPNYDQFESLPTWAKQTLADHANDPRNPCYDLETLEKSQTHDPLWNAAQRQLVKEGKIQNYLRMLWAKKVLEWAKTPELALSYLIELNNKYATDGRDPNSYSGIFWCFGRFDSGWPERAIYGKVRCMTSNSTAKKYPVEGYVSKYES
jgi:deoxyribodipyrimidine photo-lyase